MMMEETYLQELETARRTLLENCENLEQIANYCEDNYVQAKDKRVALQETKNFTTQSLASVAYQINTMATSMLQMLDCTASKIGGMDSSMNSINLTIDLNNERVSRQTLKSSLMTPKDCTRTYKMVKPGSPSPSLTSKVKYVSAPIDYGSLDDVGHGMKLGLPSSSPRGSRAGSVTSTNSRGSPQGSLRLKKSARSPVAMPSPTLSTGSRKSLQPPSFTEPSSLDNSLTYDEIPPPPTPPPPSPPHPTPVSIMIPPIGDSSDAMSDGRATPPPTSLPPPPLQDDDDGLLEDDLPPPPRPTSLLLPPAAQSPRSLSPSPQQQVSSSPVPNGAGGRLHVPGSDKQVSPKTSPGRVRKATVARKPSRSPRPMNRPPPPPSAPPPSAQPPPSATGHAMTATAASNPLYFSGPVTPSAPPPPPAPTPSGIPTTPSPGGAAPPPPPPPPPIGGTSIQKTSQKPPQSNHQEQSSQRTSKKPPAQATLSLADQLKERLAKLQSDKQTTETDARETKRDERNNNQAIRSPAPSTIETNPTPAAEFSPPSNQVENDTKTEFVSDETPPWAPSDYMWKGVSLFEYTAMQKDEMTFNEGEIIYIINDYEDGWLKGVCNGVEALVPGNYVEQMP